MVEVPRVDHRGVDFKRAPRDERIVNSATQNILRSGGGNGRIILVFVERDRREPFSYIVDDQQRLLTTHALLARKPGQGCVNFSQTMGSATGMILAGRKIGGLAGSVVDVLPRNRSHQN